MKNIYLSIAIAALTAMCISACTSQPTKEAHAHNETLQLTAYNPLCELYAEATPMATGGNVEILAHFTSLTDFKPVAADQSTASLTVGGKTIEAERVSVRKGIEKFTLKPTDKGKGELKITVANYGEFVVAVEVFGSVHAAHEDAAAKAVSSPNSIAFTKEQSWKIDFATEQASMATSGSVVKCVARVEPAKGDRRRVTALTSGTVLFATPTLTDGQAVSSGQSIMKIDSEGLADNSLGVRLQSAAARFEQARNDYERKLQLSEQQIVSKAELDVAKAEYTSAKADYENLQRNFSSNGQVVKSPMSGYVTDIAVANGSYVEAGDELFGITKGNGRVLVAEVPVRYAESLKNIGDVVVNLSDGSSRSVMQSGGRVLSVGRTVSVDSPLLAVSIEAGNSQGLVEGSFVDMTIRTKGLGEEVTVPSSAIVEQMGAKFTFVQLTPELFEKRIVETGSDDGMRCAIKSGLQAGERVVSRGAVMVKLSEAAGTLDPHAGHVH